MRVFYFIGVFVATATIAAFVVRGFFHLSENAVGQPADTTEFLSGPQVGSKIPGPFEPVNINGEKAGEEACLYCRYGNSPVAMIFAAKPTEAVAALLRPIEKSAEEARKGKDVDVGVCLVVTENNDEIKNALTNLANKENYKQAVLGMIEPRYLKKYKLHPEAEVTVLLYSNQVVRINRSFKSGEFTEKAAREVGEEAAKFLAAK
jgi:hypothetical protein